MTVKTIGLIGAGHIGSQVARLAVRHGYEVVISNSRGPETLTDLVQELGARARAGTTAQAAEAGDIVVVTIPLKSIGSVPVEPLSGKIVIDTNNYYPQRDGHIPELDGLRSTPTIARPAVGIVTPGGDVPGGNAARAGRRLRWRIDRMPCLLLLR